MIWEEKVTIPAYISDRTDHLDVWGLARIIQDAADHHTDATGCGYAPMREQGLAWVLARMYYEIYRLPSVGETVTVRTWSRGCDSLQFARDCELIDVDGNKIVGITTIWVVINYETRKLRRMTDFLSDYEHHDIPATAITNLKRLSIPKLDCMVFEKDTLVEESMIDHNNHMNNAVYLRLIFDALTGLEYDKQHCSFEINYLQETALGDTIHLSRIVDGKVAYFELTNANGLSVTAKVNL